MYQLPDHQQPSLDRTVIEFARKCRVEFIDSPWHVALRNRVQRILIFSRHHELLFEGQQHKRDDFVARTDEIGGTSPRNWSETECELMLCLSVLATARIGLEQVDRELSAESVRDILEKRISLYGHHGAYAGPVPTDLHELAETVVKQRTDVETRHYRYSIIDGAVWFRDEGLMLKQAVRPWWMLPRNFVDEISEAFAIRTPGADLADARRFIAETVEKSLDELGETWPVIEALLGSMVHDSEFAIDHATVTCPRGIGLARPAAWGASTDFFSGTVMCSETDLARYQEQLGHADEHKLRATLRARMIKLKRKATRNYFHPGCLQGEWVEKAADYMIFHNEDAHYRGHRTVGCHTGGRAAYALRLSGSDMDEPLPPMFGDLRVVRLDHDPKLRFTAEALKEVIACSQVVARILEATFERGGVVEQLEPVGDEVCRAAGDRP